MPNKVHYSQFCHGSYGMRLFLLLFLSFSSLSFYFAFNYWMGHIHPSIHPSSSRRERAIQNICAENFLWSEIIQPLFLRPRENLFVCWVSNFTCLFLKKFSVTLFQYSFSISPAISTSMMCEHEPRKLVFPCAAGYQQTNIWANKHQSVNQLHRSLKGFRYAENR